MPPDERGPEPAPQTAEDAEQFGTFETRIKRTAEKRAKYTRWHFTESGRSLDDFCADLEKRYEIEINPNDNESLALGMYKFQRMVLKFPELDDREGSDGMCGPFTLKKYEELLAKSETRSGLDALRAEISAGETVSAAPIAETPQPADFSRTESLASRERAPRLDEMPDKETAWFGDSLIVGIEKYVGDSHVFAKGGMQTNQVLQEFVKFLNAREQGHYQNVKRIVISAGVNDVASGRPFSKITANLYETYRLARLNGLEVVGCTIPPWGKKEFLLRAEKKWLKKGWLKEPFSGNPEELARRIKVLDDETAEVNEWIRKQGTNGNIHAVADLGREMDFARYPRSKDQLHPTGRGSQMMAQFIAQRGNIKFS